MENKKFLTFLILLNLINNLESLNNKIKNKPLDNNKQQNGNFYDFYYYDETEKDNALVSEGSNVKGCCDETMIIHSYLHPEGYLKAPPVYDEMSQVKKDKTINCLYKFYGRPGERIQLFYEDIDLYYPYDIYKFNKIE
jgi:hypothetical protein